MIIADPIIICVCIRCHIDWAHPLSIQIQAKFALYCSEMEQKIHNRLWHMYLTYVCFAICWICDIWADNVCQVYQTRLNEKYVCPQTMGTLVLNKITETECVTYCMHKKCGVISDNYFEQICHLDQTPCHLLQPSSLFTIQIKKSKSDTTCISWLSYDTQIPDRNMASYKYSSLFGKKLPQLPSNDILVCSCSQFL